MSFRLGIDVGGTNTDAAILDENNQLMAKAKKPTTGDISTGIKDAVETVLKKGAIDTSKISNAMLGTTHATNAIVERKRLSKVGVIRIGAPSGLAVQPMLDWPPEMADRVGKNFRIVKGGFEYDGKRITDPDEDEIREALVELKAKQIEALGVSCVFSPVSDEQERWVGELAAEILGPNFPVSLSSDIGTIGLLERENATILNATILKIADAAYASFQDVLKEHGIKADLFITQNDGTLMDLDYARKYPVFTVASGPTNSLRGAAFLSGLTDAVVVDVGGTTTDVGILKKGFPRESSKAIEIGGVTTNFRMPDLVSIGLGGGSLVMPQNGAYLVGPESVGYRITEEALVFGGKTLTATDITVASGLGDVGDKARVSSLDQDMLHGVEAKIVAMAEEAIDKMKTTTEDMPVVLVGGGSILLPDKLEGASEVVRPEHFEVANAIGATISQVSGSIDRVCDVATKGRDTVVEEVKEAAKQEAIRAGADPDKIEIVEVDEVPLAYLPSNAVRFKVKAAGPLKKSTAL